MHQQMEQQVLRFASTDFVPGLRRNYNRPTVRSYLAVAQLAAKIIKQN